MCGPDNTGITRDNSQSFFMFNVDTLHMCIVPQEIETTCGKRAQVELYKTSDMIVGPLVTLIIIFALHGAST